MFDFVLTFLIFSMIPCVYRVVKGPTIPDRVVALDAMTLSIVATLGVYSFIQGSVFFMDVALVLSIITFIGTITISKYLDEGVVF
ncbi:MAG: monovalent cation/H+ antiporter complex subunit F [Methanohalobium sp.]